MNSKKNNKKSYLERKVEKKFSNDLKHSGVERDRVLNGKLSQRFGAPPVLATSTSS